MYHHTSNKLFRFVFSFIIVLLCWLLCNQNNLLLSVYAAESEIIFSEIMYDPEGSDTDFEWIEIYNRGLTPVTIIGGTLSGSWRIGDGTSNRTLQETAYQGDMILDSQQYAVLARNPIQFMTRYPDYLEDLIQVNSLSLGNTVDTISLKIGISETPWESIIYDPSWGGDLGKSLERVDLNGINDSSNWVSSKSIHGTPGKSYVSNQLPIAELKYDQIVKVRQEVEFDASFSSDPDGQITSYYFDFGDGDDYETSEDNVTHIYKEVGTYSVKLTVTDDCGAENVNIVSITVEEIIYSDQIILSEILPYPGKTTDFDKNGVADSNDEWVELYNFGSETVDLTGWIIDDIEGGSSSYIIPENTEIKQGEYLVFYQKDTGITFNNDGDSIRLFTPDNKLVEEYPYGKLKTDQVFAKDEKGIWQVSTTPTPKIKNVITVENIVEEEIEEEDDDDDDDDDEDKAVVKEYTISEARSLPSGTEIIIQGILTATPDILGSKIIYVQDSTSGIKVKLKGGDYSTLTLGDKIKVSGVLSVAFNEIYLNMQSDSILEISSHGDALIAETKKTGEIVEIAEGKLVIINGQVVATSGNTFYINDGSGEIKVYIKDTTNIDKPKMRVGYYAEIVGIVSQYKEEYRVLPRYQEDLYVSEFPIDSGTVLGSITELPKTGKRGLKIGIIAIIMGILLKIIKKI
ncbi:hypothetical protein A2X44_01385 [candidate division CPR3 bacterium GWF2_35_18]|uniref:Nucleic acid binding OB-fold tRNA/helicase-type n=1 Tax=candidate division CPR3 bacterium GW2011_GWF2_35_18 TaxID=1618350 RepID=A0A0G0ESS0_UNCC3|nr:MAG: Nucleic acid binding OB-fold tRNA/helicase-type [candidate division CPR3 bacterium GW2011_GWF2_35_18]OGB63555.1 MAG: hypothetical protein A2X44_01385 [candidate division CPR3 bacterium GWF2_35_18]OGB64664.1 MAG: hypothetical protein A2250_03935 [candidate division CPR3 bacterium RIFOXYA2_FULL_35_13]OGB75950.1 MAG: hypothetical protein A2476_03405 [candidate division CPR3 bacterium RIFOXYC2_FULL_35_7]OGB78775.1 MAG: hypothetical protein A2296_00180 [candidate division CPR3 bacterium RIFO